MCDLFRHLQLCLANKNHVVFWGKPYDHVVRNDVGRGRHLV